MKRGPAALAGLLCLAVAGLLPSAAGAQTKEFVANIFFPDKHPIAKHSYAEWAVDLEKASGGRLKAKVFYGSSLLEPRAGLSGVRDGIAQIGHHAALYTPSELPESNVLNELSFGITDPLVAMAAVTEFEMTDPQMQAQWKKAGVVFAGGYSTPQYVMMCSKPVRNLEEIKGKRLRTAGASVSRWVQTVGAVAVNIPSTEMYTGLEKGSLDCATNVVSDLKSRSLWDVAKHTTMASLGMYYAGPNWAVNPKFWQELSPADRRLLFNVNAQAMANLYVGYQEAIAEALAEARQHGVSFYEPGEDLKNSIRSFVKTSYEEIYSLAKEKYKVSQPEALVERFLKTVAKWEKLFAQVDRKDSRAIGKIIRENHFDRIDVAAYGK
ncbi:MAG: C4-dicarboxylate TRAP transporter substrate-binding protein [Desulfobacterales bacterium]